MTQPLHSRLASLEVFGSSPFLMPATLLPSGSGRHARRALLVHSGRVLPGLWETAVRR